MVRKDWMIYIFLLCCSLALTHESSLNKLLYEKQQHQQKLKTITNNKRSLKQVIGVDSRIVVDMTTLHPFNAVGRLRNGCVGVLVGPKHVLTTAHCLYDTDDMDWRNGTGFAFSPGQNGEEFRPYGEIKFKRAIVTKEYFWNGTMELDVGMIELARSPSGIKPFRIESSCERQIFDLNLVGYPITLEPPGKMWLSTCEAVRMDCNSYFYRHICDTSQGMSGSPMWVYRPDEKEEGEGYHSIRGIHLGVEPYQERNRGLTITPDIQQRINKWIERLS
eukprot:TRINITY_DN22063_c0_g1_i1.p1 TRINITY_DN22063_c0_g1~~TRINITY_DN22063_c0_g1_i1.p1  ORF type:complete len:276 (-),score=25.07 TRINITY_DN22063_c0_g1_i1:237-1064(-)